MKERTQIVREEVTILMSGQAIIATFSNSQVIWGVGLTEEKAVQSLRMLAELMYDYDLN